MAFGLTDAFTRKLQDRALWDAMKLRMPPFLTGDARLGYVPNVDCVAGHASRRIRPAPQRRSFSYCLANVRHIALGVLKIGNCDHVGDEKLLSDHLAPILFDCTNRFVDVLYADKRR